MRILHLLEWDKILRSLTARSRTAEGEKPFYIAHNNECSYYYMEWKIFIRVVINSPRIFGLFFVLRYKISEFTSATKIMP